MTKAWEVCFQQNIKKADNNPLFLCSVSAPALPEFTKDSFNRFYNFKAQQNSIQYTQSLIN